MRIPLIWIFSPRSVRKRISECVRFLSSKGRGEREDGRSVRKRNDAPDAPFDSISCSPPSLWRVCSGSSPSSCEARDVSSFEAIVDDMSGQACGKITERQRRKETKLGKLKSTFCRISVKPELSIITSSSSLSSGTVHFFPCVCPVASPSAIEKGRQVAL